MALPNNTLQVVETYQMSRLAWMLNEYVYINKSNKKFKDFEKITANLGDTITWDLAPRSIAIDGLVIAQQPAQQRIMSMACSQAANISNAFSDQQLIFQSERYLDRFEISRIKELGNRVEIDMLKNFVSGVRVNNPQDPNFGQNINPASGPYRFFGNGVDAINSYGQLAQALANFRDYGAADGETCGLIPMVDVPAIINNGLSQFALNRNNENAMSWELGDFSGADWYQSNLLPVHVAGTAGQDAETLTLVSTNDPTGANITQLTFSSSLGNDANAVKAGDMFQFNDGVPGFPDERYRQFIGHSISAQPVQFRATADAAAIAGVITVDIYPALVSQPNLNQNLSSPLQAGMQTSVLPSHRAGAIWSGDPLYMAMPRLNDQTPFPTVMTSDPDTGASLRAYWGTQFGQNISSYVTDTIWGSAVVAENSMRLIFPL